MRLAQMNVATALYDLDDPRMADFMNSLDRVNALADAAPGFVWRLTGEGGNATDIKTAADPRFIVNMSVWDSAEALFAFVYRSEHRTVMMRRREWFAQPSGPYHVLWWVEIGSLPTVADGLARLGLLAEQGPSAAAFTFKSVYPANRSPPPGFGREARRLGWA
jgi:hypothetical protein